MLTVPICKSQGINDENSESITRDLLPDARILLSSRTVVDLIS
jgi:hypothetical protein